MHAWDFSVPSLVWLSCVPLQEVDAILDGLSTSAEHGQQQQIPQAVAAGLCEEELKQIVATAHPELQGLLKELQDALGEINSKVEPLVSLAKRRNFLTKEVRLVYRQRTGTMMMLSTAFLSRHHFHICLGLCM